MLPRKLVLQQVEREGNTAENPKGEQKACVQTTGPAKVPGSPSAALKLEADVTDLRIQSERDSGFGVGFTTENLRGEVKG